MLFHITQTHTPELCPKDEGGSKCLYNPNVEGLKLRAVYGAFSEHEEDQSACITQTLKGLS